MNTGNDTELYHTNTDVTTTQAVPLEIWRMSDGLFITSNIVLIIQLCTGVTSNVLLVVTICYSPSLKTPPNAHLVNICINNIIMCSCMMCSFISSMLSVSLDSYDKNTSKIFGNLQLFLSLACFMHYCTIFSSIGYYRCKTVKNPSMSVKVRSKIITKSIVFGWILSLTVACSITLSYRDSLTSLSWNPFRKNIYHSELDSIQRDLKPHQIGLLYAVFFIVIFLTGIIIKSYHYILKTLLRANAVCKNKVNPWERRTSSLSSDGNDLMATSQRSYKPEESSDVTSRPPFAISNGHVLIDNFMVHYQKANNSVSFIDEAFALENPLKVQPPNYSTQNKPPLTAQLSNASQGSTKNGIRPEFTDISPAAELHRFQSIKNKRALHNQSLRRDRISLGGATKNSIIMISTFMICSIPVFICAIPGVIDTHSVSDLTLPLLMCQLVFYLNAPAYPIWYLVFSKRVRKCLLKLYDTALIKCKIRQ